MAGDKVIQQGLLIAEQLRSQLPGLQLITHCGGGSFKNQFKHADKTGAQWAFILGEDELAHNTLSIKYLREDRPQKTLLLQDFSKDFLEDFLKEKN